MPLRLLIRTTGNIVRRIVFSNEPMVRVKLLFSVPVKTTVLFSVVTLSVYAAEGNPSPREAAPIELTGQWVSVMTEDWLWRMIVPPRGDTVSVPLNETGLSVAAMWDPDSDRANRHECRAYGAAGIMRMPGRIRIKWLDDNALQLETDTGRQKRVFNFGENSGPSVPASQQGDSVARWSGYVSTLIGHSTESTPSYLKVVTTNLLPGYLRLNGVPYSDQAKVTEYYHLQSGYGREWLTVTTLVEDEIYLAEPFITTTDFLRENDRESWNPRPCVSHWGPVREFDPTTRVLE